MVYDRKKVSKKTGTGKIELSVYLQEGERKWITVGTASPDKWMSIAESISITSKVTHYEEVIKAMKLLKEEMTIANFNRHVEVEELSINQGKTVYNGHDLRQSFVEYCRTAIQKEGLAKNSLKGFHVVFNAVEESGKLKTLADLTPKNVLAFDVWLHSKNDKTDYTIHGYHKKVHKYTRLLWRNNMISSDPYEHVKFRKGSTKERIPLIEEELIKMRDAEYTGHLERARDLFVFMAYTGLAYCDMSAFNFKTMTEQHSDFWYIDGSRLKTGSRFFTPILPPALEVLKKYDYKLPVISNQKINDYCHVIEKDLKINKSISCHVARHSFATLVLSYDIPMENLQRMLGHKNITTTQIYGKILKKNVEQHVEKLVAILK